MRLRVFLLASLFGLAVVASHARDYKAGTLDIGDPWSRATPKGSSVAAGYMKIKNTGSTDQWLIRRGTQIRGTRDDDGKWRGEDATRQRRLGNQTGRHR